MKTKLTLLLAVLLPLAAHAADDLSTALQKGFFEEEANQNLPAAIKAYESLLAASDEQRKLAATALFRLGECYRKLGRTNDAVAQYQRLLRDYADQGTLATLSRQNLTGLGVSEARPRGKGMMGLTFDELMQLQAAQNQAGAAPTDEEEQGIRRIQALIKDSPDLVNAVNVEVTKTRSGELMVPKNGTLLHKAASLGQLVVAKFLLEHGASVTVRDELEKLPLHWAAGNGHKAMVELLLASGADVNARVSPSWPGNGETALYLAADKGFRTVCETLLAKGADPNLGDSSGTPPIYSAVFRGDEAMLRLLLAKGAKANPPPGKKAYTPLHNATSTNIGRILIENGAVVDALNSENRNPLHVKVQTGNREMVELLLNAGANPRLKDGGGTTPLHLAAENWQASVVAPLIAKGAEPNERNAYGAVALDYLIKFNDRASRERRERNQTPQLETLEALLAGGADPNLLSTGGAPHLYRAVAEGFEDLAEALLKAGADPNAKTDFESQNKGMTALTRALMGGSKQRSMSLVNLLLEHKADPNLADGSGNTPLYLAIGWGGEDFAGKGPFVEALLNRGANIEGRNGSGDTPLIVAAHNRMKEMVALLLKNKADPNGKSRSGSTPLHRAAITQNTDILELLLAAGADPNALDGDGRSALDYVKVASLPSPPGGLRLPRSGSPVPGSFGQPSSQRQEASQSELADRLRKAGARDWAPRPGLITVTRRSTGASQVIFTKGTNDWNRYSLLEVIGHTYFGSDTKFPFPDFSKVRITRADASAVGGIKEFTLDLAAGLAKDGCKADQPLGWGDLIDIPEGEHKLGERWSRTFDADDGAISKCLGRSVTIVVKGKSNEVPLAARNWISTHGANGVVTYSPEKPFALRRTVLDSGFLLTSSDTTRVKVTRSDAVNGFKEWTFDLSKEPSAGNDLWLRDGDRIEVPEKP